MLSFVTLGLLRALAIAGLVVFHFFPALDSLLTGDRLTFVRNRGMLRCRVRVTEGRHHPASRPGASSPGLSLVTPREARPEAA